MKRFIFSVLIIFFVIAHAQLNLQDELKIQLQVEQNCPMADVQGFGEFIESMKNTASSELAGRTAALVQQAQVRHQDLSFEQILNFLYAGFCRFTILDQTPDANLRLTIVREQLNRIRIVGSSPDPQMVPNQGQIWDSANLPLNNAQALDRPRSLGEGQASYNCEQRCITYSGGGSESGGGGTSPELQSTVSYKVTVFFGTDRAPLPAQANHDIEFSGEAGDRIIFGSVDVSIPPTHRIGSIERPFALFGISLIQDISKHVVVLRTQQLEADSFFNLISNATLTRQHPSRTFIFIHGYNVKFADAALRAAQLSVDLDAEAVPVFYSWPSEGSTPKYTIDEQNVQWSEPNLRRFLEMYAERSKSDEIVLIAHSMGTRAAVNALSSLLRNRPDLRPRFKQLILAAPDIDARIFIRDIMPTYKSMSTSVTLYASSKDKALAASKEIHGYTRAGESGAGIVLAAGAETIDASEIDTDFLGHSYAVGTRPLLTDMVLIEKNHLAASSRPSLEKVTNSHGVYWRFRQ